MSDVEYILRRITGAQESANRRAVGQDYPAAEKEVGAFEGFRGVLLLDWLRPSGRRGGPAGLRSVQGGVHAWRRGGDLLRRRGADGGVR